MPEIDKIKIKETTYDIKDTTARSQGLPSGGTINQILKKKSNTDYDTEWGSISTSWGDITGTLSDQTDLQDALDNKADVIINSTSGAIVSIPDAKASPVVGLTVGIEPVQDLHGQTSPYPAGGGVNKWDEVEENGNISEETGQPSGTSSSYKRTVNFIPCEPETGYYFYSATRTGNFRQFFYDADKNYLGYQGKAWNTVITTPENAKFMKFRISSSNTMVGDISVNYPATVTTYSPYSNVCPISGHTETVVTRTGRNLLKLPYADASVTTMNGLTFTVHEDGTVDVSGTATANTNWKLEDFHFLAGKTYWVQGCPSGGSTGSFSILVSGLTSEIGAGKELGNSTSPERTVAVNLRIINGTTVNLTFKPMVMLKDNSGLVDYEPPQYAQITISLGQTVYGGTLDVLAGTLTITHAYHLLNDSSKWINGTGTTQTYSYDQKYDDRKIFANSVDGLTCSAFPCNISKPVYGRWNGSTGLYFGVKDTGSNITLAEIQTMATAGDIAILYELATPVVITGLTPATLSLLYGTNIVWADTGDINIQYKIDTKEYIDNSRTYYVKGTQTASTGNWTGDLLQIKELYEGLAIDYWLPFAGSGNATLTLTLKNGTTNPIPVYYGGTTRVTTTQPVNTVWRYVYQTVEINNVEYTGWWAVRAYDSNTTYNYFSNLVHNRGKFVADSDIYRYNILFHIDDDTLTPLNNANNSTATTKTMLTNVAFDPFAEIFYYGSSGSFSANGEVAASYLTWNHENVDLRYTLNSGSTLTADKYIYLKVIMQSDGKCKLASDPCWTQTLPSTADGYHYIFLGRAHSTTSISFYYYHPVFYHDGTSIKIMQNPKIAGSGGGTWGNISGTLSDQTDLQAALDSKATTTELDNYLPLSGGTMTGNINYQISTIDSTSTPASTINEHIFYILDNNGNPIGNIESSLSDSGEILFKFGAVRNINDTNVFNNITCRIGSDGTADYILKSPAAFRNALGITDIATRPDYIISSVDLIDGVSELESGKLYFYYEA